MSDWSIIVAKATTNLITNPSFENATTGWAAMAGAIARSTDDPPFGLYNLKCTPAVATMDGCYFATVALTSGTTYTASIYVKGVNAIPYKLYFADTGAALKGTATTFTGDGAWHRHEVTWVCDSTASYRIYVTKNNSASVAPFYVDALQVEAQSAATSYCDGSIAPPPGFVSSGCSWNGVAHASASTRAATSRAGGQLYDLEDTYKLKPLQIIGAGAPPTENYSTPYALLDGSLFEHSRIAERIFAINGLLTGTSTANFMASRGALYDALKCNNADEPVLLRYTGAARTLEISAYYAGGLEGGMMYALIEQIQLRFLATSPNWREVIV